MSGSRDNQPVDTTNDFLVGSNGHDVVIALPPMRGMTPEKALRLAAWLVVCSMAVDFEAEEHFRQTLEAVMNT